METRRGLSEEIIHVPSVHSLMSGNKEHWHPLVESSKSSVSPAVTVPGYAEYVALPLRAKTQEQL